MDKEDMFLIGTIMLLSATVGLTSIKSFWIMVLGSGIALIIIALVKLIFAKDKNSEGANK